MDRSFFQFLMIAWLTVINAVEWSQFDEKPEKYGLLVNEGHKFQGDIIVVFYEQKFGLYPHYRNFSDISSAVNGGIPQRADLSAHLEKVRNNIEKAIPKVGFNGLAIIDYEEWRPLWKHNWYTKRIYQKASIDDVKQRQPEISEEEAEKIAEKEFNNASMVFLTKTIQEAKKLRPNALWGYYGMPFCNYSAGKNGTVGCGEWFEEYNDR
ncbi:unnamed protein product, partial [Cercopithifilaria johnstoni]